MFEPIIKTDISMLPKTIETNLADLEPFIWDKVDSANKLVVDATSIEACERAEADAALLTKMAKKIAEFRLTWTKYWQSPFEAVIAKCKDYESRLKAAGDDLRGRAKVGRDRVRQQKYERLRGIWEARCAERFGLTEQDLINSHFSRYLDEMCAEKTVGSWTNRAKSDSKIFAEMDAELDRCASARKVVESTYANEGQDVKVIAMDALKLRYDVAETIAAVNSYKELSRKAEAAKAEAAKAEAAKAEAARQVEAAKVETPAVETVTERTLTQDDPIMTYRLKVTGTRKALTALRSWGEAHGVTFKRIEE